MDKLRKGDFLVPEEHFERAQEVHESKSERRQSLDKATRGLVTTDIETYENVNGVLLDYPGVDTPSENPRQQVFDFPFPGELQEATNGEGLTVDPQPEPFTQERAKFQSDVKQQGKSLWHALFGRD